MPKKLRILALLAFSIIIYWKNYVIVIGQTPKPVLVALNKTEGSLAIIDPLEMKVLGKVPTGEGPHEVIFLPDGRTAIVANYGTGPKPGNSFSVIDVEAKKELRRVDLSPLLRPHGIQEIGGKVYFTSETNRLIARYDAATDKVDWLMGTGQNASHMIAGSADQKKFYTANIASDSVTAFEFQNVPPAGSRITHIPVGKQPEAIDLSPDGKEVWVGLNAENAVDVIDTATNKVKERVTLGDRPYRVRFTPDGQQVAATLINKKQVSLLDAATRKEVKNIQLESVPLGIVFSKDSKIAFVTVVQSDYVLKIDLEKGEVISKVEIGQGPDGIALFGM